MNQPYEDPQNQRIHMRWFKNRLRKGELQHKVDAIYTDDYLGDARDKFQKTEEFQDTPPDFFGPHEHLDGPWTWASGEKKGEFRLTVNMNNHYTFRLKPVELKSEITSNNQK